MNIDEALYDYLIGNTAITDLVEESSICWLEADQDVAFPRIVFLNISKPVIYDSDDQWQRWRFIISHSNKQDCKAIANELFNQIHRKDDELTTGFDVDYISNIVNGDPEFNKVSEVWELIQDYRITYH